MTERNGPIHLSDDNFVAILEANRPARGSIRISVGNSRFQADAEISPLGLLAVGGMVSAILLAVAPIIREAVRSRNRH
jgi:hypothetical protein